MPEAERLKRATANLRGDGLAEIVGNADGLMAKVCWYAKNRAAREKCEPWSIIGKITGHGSGVSAAIYECYRERKDDDA